MEDVTMGGDSYRSYAPGLPYVAYRVVGSGPVPVKVRR
jgi:hypothetical protein